MPGKSRALKVPDNELHLRRLQTDEALARLDTYLNQAFMARLDVVRIVHGKGTGKLRQVVRHELLCHPLVKSVRIASGDEGGEGVTVVGMEYIGEIKPGKTPGQ